MKMNSSRILSVLLIILLVLSLSACSSDKGGGSSGDGSSGDGSDKVSSEVSGGGSGDITGDGSAGGGDDTATLVGTKDVKDDTGVAAKNSGSGQDSPDPAEFLPDGYLYYFPEYKDSIIWYTLPLDYVGSFAMYVQHFEEKSSGAINVRSKPTIKAAVAGQIIRGDESYWWIKQEFYMGEKEYFLGMYQVLADDFTWTYVAYSSEDSSLTGWVALETVEVISL